MGFDVFEPGSFGTRALFAPEAEAGTLSARERDPGGVAASLSGVAKAFGQRGVLRSLDLQVAPGEFVAIVGRSGCGKSTVLRLLSGLERADAGEMLIDGQPPFSGNPLVRMMFQDARLLPWRRVGDNVALGLPPQRLALAREALGEVGLADRAGEWPRVLSGGQRQRVALARALAARPRLLLLDEPLGALDALTRIEMQALIERIWLDHRVTALLVTHDVAEAVALADRIIVLDAGRVAHDVPVGLPRPRPRTSREFAALEAEVLARVLGEPHGEPGGQLALARSA
ncbi:MAG: ATP-binding cassette domain-containing protein [Chloroflexota bacterium]